MIDYQKKYDDEVMFVLGYPTTTVYLGEFILGVLEEKVASDNCNYGAFLNGKVMHCELETYEHVIHAVHSYFVNLGDTFTTSEVVEMFLEDTNNFVEIVEQSNVDDEMGFNEHAYAENK